MNIKFGTKFFWSTIKRFKGNHKQQIPYIRDYNNRKLHTDREKEQHFRQHWAKIYTEDSDEEEEDFDTEHINNIKTQLQDTIHLTTPHDNGDTSRLGPHCPPITIEELNRTISSLQQKAPGNINITAAHLKHLTPKIKEYLLYIFNNSLSSGYFPDTFKIAKLIFIPKPQAAQTQVQNYRPISLLNTHAKLLDKILNNRLTLILQTKDLYNTRQHGFRHNRGTHTALATLHEYISLAHAQRHKINIIQRDVTKAFDKVWHLGLKYKLLQTDIHPLYIKILSDFITDRQATININTHTGPPFTLQTGVPQGSCLSPTLYSFYTHDTPNPTPKSEHIIYADDITQIVTAPGSVNFLNIYTANAINNINEYEQKWKIKTNINKFRILPIFRRTLHDIVTEQETYTQHTNITVLGLKMNTRLYTGHVTQTLGRCYQTLNKLYTHFNQLNTYNKRKLYLTLIRPILTYPPIPLHTLSTAQQRKLQRVQNNATRYIQNTRITDFISSETLHRRSYLTPLNIILHQQATKTWNTIRQHIPEAAQTLTFPNDLPDRPTIPSSYRLTQTQPNPILR